MEWDIWVVFFPLRCALCNDKICSLADASFADAWVSDIVKNDVVGTSLIVSRNDVLRDILKNMVLKNKIELKEVNEEIVQKSQALISSKNKINAHIGILNLFGLKTPINVQNDFFRPSILDYFFSLMFFYRIKVMSKRKFWFLIDAYRFYLEKIFSLKNKLKKLIGR